MSTCSEIFSFSNLQIFKIELQMRSMQAELKRITDAETALQQQLKDAQVRVCLCVCCVVLCACVCVCVCVCVWCCIVLCCVVCGRFEKNMQ